MNQFLKQIPVGLQVIGMLGVLAGIWMLFGLAIFLFAGGVLVAAAGTVAELDQRVGPARKPGDR